MYYVRCFSGSQVTTPTGNSPGYYISGALGYSLSKVNDSVAACNALVFSVDGVAVSSQVDAILSEKGFVATAVPKSE